MYDRAVYCTDSDASVNLCLSQPAVWTNMPKRTEQNLIVCSSKSEAEVTNNKRQHSRYCTAGANYRQTRTIAWPLCNNRAFCYWSGTPLVAYSQCMCQSSKYSHTHNVNGHILYMLTANLCAKIALSCHIILCMSLYRTVSTV